MLLIVSEAVVADCAGPRWFVQLLLIVLEAVASVSSNWTLSGIHRVQQGGANGEHPAHEGRGRIQQNPVSFTRQVRACASTAKQL